MKSTFKITRLTLISLLLIISLIAIFFYYNKDIGILNTNDLKNKIYGSQNQTNISHNLPKKTGSEKSLICEQQAIIEKFFLNPSQHLDKDNGKSKDIINAIKKNGIEKLPIYNDECGANVSSLLSEIFSKIGLTEKATKYYEMSINFANQGNPYAIKNLCINTDSLFPIENRIRYCESIFDNPLINYDSVTKFLAYKFLSSYYFETNQGIKLANFCEKNHNRKEVCYYSFMLPSVNRLAERQFDKKNYKQAFYLYKKAAPYDEKGEIQAQLGIMYFYGLGTEKNIAQTILMFNSVLKKNTFITHKQEAMIMNMLGLAYEEQNKYVEAFQSYHKAATLGDALAQYNLARLFAQGHGTIQDFKESYAWVSVSIAQGLPKKQNQNKAEQFQNLVRELLLEQDKKGLELSESQNLAKKYYQLYVLTKKYGSYGT